jgi:hypothetical protein
MPVRSFAYRLATVAPCYSQQLTSALINEYLLVVTPGRREQAGDIRKRRLRYVHAHSRPLARGGQRLTPRRRRLTAADTPYLFVSSRHWRCPVCPTARPARKQQVTEPSQGLAGRARRHAQSTLQRQRCNATATSPDRTRRQDPKNRKVYFIKDGTRVPAEGGSP